MGWAGSHASHGAGASTSSTSLVLVPVPKQLAPGPTTGISPRASMTLERYSLTRRQAGQARCLQTTTLCPLYGA